LHQVLLASTVRSGMRLHLVYDLRVDDLNLVLVVVSSLRRITLTESLPFLGAYTSTCATHLHTS